MNCRLILAACRYFSFNFPSSFKLQIKLQVVDVASFRLPRQLNATHWSRIELSSLQRAYRAQWWKLESEFEKTCFDIPIDEINLEKNRPNSDLTALNDFWAVKIFSRAANFQVVNCNDFGLNFHLRKNLISIHLQMNETFQSHEHVEPNK